MRNKIWCHCEDRLRHGGGEMKQSFFSIMIIRLLRSLRSLAMTGIFLFILSIVLLPASSSYAHERRVVQSQYEFVVGFVNEPAFSGEMNGVDLRVNTMGFFGKPVEGLEKTLKVRVVSADEKEFIDLALRRKYKESGRYTGYFLPTRPGKYIFHIQGNINGAAIDEIFASGEKTFHDVEDAQPLRFPK